MVSHRWAIVLGCLLVAALSRGAAAGKAGSPPLKGAIIVVDPGHGGQRYSKSYTGGTRGVTSGRPKGELTMRVGLELAKLLQAEGATVYLTRETDHRLTGEGSSNFDELHAR